MNIGDRMKEIRKSLGLTQAEFGEKLGLKPTAIGLYENGTRNVTERTLILLREKHNVNTEYLQYGTGEMFIEPTTFSLDEYAKSKSLSEKEIVLVREFMNLDSTVRNALFGMFEKAFSSDVWNGSPYEDCPKTPEELEKQFPPVEDQKNSGVS